MKRIVSLLREVELVKHVLPAFLFGASLGLFIHGYWLIDVFPVGSKRLLFLTLLIILLGFAGYVLLFRWLTNALRSPSKLQTAGIIGASLLAGSFLFFTVTGNWQKPARYVSLFLPTHTLEITVPAEQNKDDISISWISTALGDISYETIRYSGWELNKDQLALSNISNNRLRWTGKTGEETQIVFENPSRSGYVILSWDGQEETIHLPRKKNTYVHSFDVPFYASSNLTLLLGILNFSLLTLPLCFFVWKKRVEILQPVYQGFSWDARKIERREWLIVMVLIVVAFALRVPNLEILFPNVEEYSHLNAAKQIIQGTSLNSVYQRSLWLVTIPVSVIFRIFGYELWAARLLSVIINTLALIPLYLVTRKMNRPVAVLSIVLFTTNPWMIALSRVVREYAYYPFFFLWIIYGMIIILEEIPDRFHIDRDWKAVLKPKLLFLATVLAFPIYYAIGPDYLSTAKLVLIAYAVFGFFIVLKVDAGYVKNLPLILILIGLTFIGVYSWYRQFSFHFQVGTNLVPLHYFFLNSPQQWYFDRLALIPFIALAGTVVAAVLIRRINILPLFFLALFAGYLGFFVLSMNRYFAPRHLSTTQLWYIILVAIGLYLFWLFITTFSLFKENWARILTLVVLVGLVMNFQQVVLPVTSADPSMPVTEDYHNDLTDLQSYILANMKTGDVLISSRIYSRYIEWVGEPNFQKVYNFQVQSTEEEVLSVVDQFDSGWIIIDNARIERAVFSPDVAFLNDDRIEYIGLFDDEHVWRWRAK